MRHVLFECNMRPWTSKLKILFAVLYLNTRIYMQSNHHSYLFIVKLHTTFNLVRKIQNLCMRWRGFEKQIDAVLKRCCFILKGMLGSYSNSFNVVYKCTSLVGYSIDEECWGSILKAAQ